MNCEDHSIVLLLAYEILFTGLFTCRLRYSQFLNNRKAMQRQGFIAFQRLARGF
jgi:hypothetical protein